MIKNIVYSLCIVAIFNSCSYNSLEDDTTIDCSMTSLDFSITATDASCGQSDGSISVLADGGVPPYSYSLDNGSSQSSSKFENIPSGNYTVTVTDNAPCNLSKEILVASVGGFQATASVTDSGCKSNNGTLTASPSGGVEPYDFKLNGGISQSDPLFINLEAGEHNVIITDADGCDFSILKTILSGTSYGTTVDPIISSSCSTTGCHDGSTSQTNFTIFSNVQGSAAAIKSRTQSGNMPKNGTLTQVQKDAIACWVDDGALDN